MIPARKIIERLHPAYFAMVMATGVVSINIYLEHWQFLAHALLWLNVTVFLILVTLTCLRIIWFPSFFLADLTDHNRSIGFFSAVAASCVLGRQFIVVTEDYQLAKLLWFAGLILWLFLTYTIFTALTVKESKPTLDQGINGGWLLSVVATQAVSVLGSMLAQQFGPYEQPVLFFSLSLWLCGGMLYIWMISLIFYRYTFFKFSPSDLAPPYWINMGAMAISTLAGTTLIQNADQFVFLQEILPFIKGFTMFFWATATWWFPMLLFLALWRHFYKRFPWVYDPLYWGLVFPLAMYAACTFQLAGIIGLPILLTLSRCFVYISLIAWLIVFAGFLSRLYRSDPP
jgi:tellurite resistance protein TehA-like permease